LSSPRISIVIPTYNKRKDVLECLHSLRKLYYPNYEIIVVDNGSTDGTSNAIERLFPEVKLVKSRSNLGVTGGRNLGAKHSSGEYIFFLDHDTTVNEKILVELMRAMHNNPKIGIVGPAIYYYSDPKRIWALGTSINMLTGRVSFNHEGKIDHGKFVKAMEVQILPAAFLVRKEVINKVGLFDDIFFAVYEDTDFCFRVKEAGYKVLCVPTAKVWHKVSPDERKSIVGVLSRAYLVSRNRIIFMKKHSNSFLAFIVFFLPVYLIYYSLHAFCLNRIDWLKSFLKGTVSGIAITLKLH
jgi:hypothetical protein